VQDAIALQLLQHLAQAMAFSDVVVVSGQQWKNNLHTWAPAVPVVVVAPGIDPAELRKQALLGASGYWASILGSGSHYPILAVVGRADPSKNFDTVLKVWGGLVKDKIRGTLCVHLTPTTRGTLTLYRKYAETLYQRAAEANGYRSGSVILFERQNQQEALWLLQKADVVVACSRADGWNLVAAEACALGTDTQRLIISSQVGAVDLLWPIAYLVDDPLNMAELEQAICAAIQDLSSHDRISRAQVLLPKPEDWLRGIIELHHRFSRPTR
jgi:trehalose-6-phosphate synthase